MRLSGPVRLPILALVEWLMVLPATVLLGAAAMRLFQPRQYEPARTSWAIFEWSVAHISRQGAGVLFLAIPGLVVMVGCLALLRAWSENETLRHDALASLAILWRQRAAICVLTATLLGGAVLSGVVAHLVAD